MNGPFDLDPKLPQTLEHGNHALFQYEQRRGEIFDDPWYPTKLLPELPRHRIAEMLERAIKSEVDDHKPPLLDLRLVRDWENRP